MLFLLFLGLKLTGYIAWSWVWVTAPLWIPLALVLIMLAIIGIVAGIVALVKPKPKTTIYGRR